MKIEFPKNFIWGTSTAAYQIESASNHDWKGVKCKDGTIFDKCSMHDSHRRGFRNIFVNYLLGIG